MSLRIFIRLIINILFLSSLADRLVTMPRIEVRFSLSCAVARRQYVIFSFTSVDPDRSETCLH
jgi:hypothetical protein